MIERELMGGDCLNIGCVPSKALLRSARALADARDVSAYGVAVPDGAGADFPAVMERMRRLRAELSAKDSAARYRDLGVDVFIGDGSFFGSRLDRGRTARRCGCAAPQSRPAPAPRRRQFPALPTAGYLTNETVFSLTALPAA